MGILEVAGWMRLGEGVGMIILWSILFVHVWRGNKNKWLLLNIVLLLIAGLGTTIFGYVLVRGRVFK